MESCKIAKNLSHSEIPNNLTLGGVNVPKGSFAESFARHFHSKVIINAQRTKVDSNVYNGKWKLIVLNINFMQSNDVKSCLNYLSSKKCEGFDCIPACALFDARAVLLYPFPCCLKKSIRHALFRINGELPRLFLFFKRAVNLKLKIIDLLLTCEVHQKNSKNLSQSITHSTKVIFALRTGKRIPLPLTISYYLLLVSNQD